VLASGDYTLILNDDSKRAYTSFGQGAYFILGSFGIVFSLVPVLVFECSGVLPVARIHSGQEGEA
jgi:hypothetical protein